jgi:dATP pyrophosphohydrolase
MRAPFQVLVIPFRKSNSNIEYAIFKRSDADYWQFIAGGGEDGETPEQAAQREASEEAGVSSDSHLIRLDSTSTVPKENFAAAKSWPSTLYVVPEYCFAVDLGKSDIAISPEHLEFRWVLYGEAQKMLEWDSNRNALWEINERLLLFARA